MKTIFSRIICIGLVVTAAGAISTHADEIDDESWQAIYSELSGKNFDELDGFTKHEFIAVAHLTNHNQIAFELSKKLTDADWAQVAGKVAGPDAMYLGIGHTMLYGMFYDIHGDNDTAFKYCERGMELLKNGKPAEEMAQWEVSKALSQYDMISGIGGVIAFHDLLYPRPHAKPTLAEAYANVGQIMRALKQIEEVEKALADTTTLSADTKPDSINADAVIDDMIDQRKKEKMIEDATTVQIIIERITFYNRIALFNYCYGNALLILGQDAKAIAAFYEAVMDDPSCHIFCKAYLDHQKDKKQIEISSKLVKGWMKERQYDSSAMLFTYDCLTAMGKPDKAVSEFTKYLKTHPDNSIALAERGRAYYEMRDYVKAAADASASIAADSTNFEGWYVLAVAAQATADPKAKEYFESVLMHSPKELLMYTRAEEALKKE